MLDKVGSLRGIALKCVPVKSDGSFTEKAKVPKSPFGTLSAVLSPGEIRGVSVNILGERKGKEEFTIDTNVKFSTTIYRRMYISG